MFDIMQNAEQEKNTQMLTKIWYNSIIYQNPCATKL